MLYVVKMSDGRGHVEWYRGLSKRMQAFTKEDAQHFTSPDAAQRAVNTCARFPEAFSETYRDPTTGRCHIETTIEPL